MTIWTGCHGEQHIKALHIEPWRIVEAQHISSSRDLVDTLDEHDVLEDLLESTKPPIGKDKDYLIFTPFRYPPLNYGSRFGNQYEPSLWYGSIELETAFAEVAYYRLQFFQDTAAQLDYIEIPMTAFRTCLQTNRGIDLTEPPFDAFTKQISDKNSYRDSQALGSAMREAHIESLIYYSARTHTPGKNIAAFTSKVFQKKKDRYIHHQQNWICMANQHIIEFTRLGILKKERHVFSAELSREENGELV
ncbi:MAG: RES family NAD+ phosphorylase [Gammaproteobacteria bacterium]|nr:RES family NAD+ phosphorylase [Gammaproteobacteria bacterium]